MSTPNRRIWPVFVVFLLVILAQGCSGALLVIPAFVGHDFETGPPDEAVIETYMQAPSVMLAMLVLAQLAILVPVGIAAAASPTPWRTRLGLQWGHASRNYLPLFCLGSLGAGSLGSLLVDLEESSYAQDLATAIQGAPGVMAVGFILLGSLLPGVIEELAFRGYVQTRLLQRWPAWASIGLSSVLFAVFHIEPLYMVVVFPIGVWLGFLAVRTGGTVQGMVCHIFNNAVAFGVMALEPKLPEVSASVEMLAKIVLIGCLVASVWVLVRMKPPFDGAVELPASA
jgi:hypothetical protein